MKNVSYVNGKYTVQWNKYKEDDIKRLKCRIARENASMEM